MSTDVAGVGSKRSRAAQRDGITGADVARAVGVSATAVSLAFSTRPEDRTRVGAATRERIRQTAAELGYTPNHVAASLRWRRTGTLVVIVQTLGNPYYTGIIDGAQQVATARGYSLTTLEVGQSAVPHPSLAVLRGRGADGVILASHSSYLHQEILHLVARGVAAVAVQNRGLARCVPTVASHGEVGAFLATNHLLRLGHRRIAHLCVDPPARLRTQRTRDPEHRLLGYRRALIEAGIEFDPNLVSVGAGTLRGGADSARRLLERRQPRPTAIFAFNDLMALGAISTLAASGIKVPEEVAVVGFDGIELGEFSVPALTTVADSYHERGRRAAEILCDVLAGTRPLEGGVETLSEDLVRLIIRESCGARLADCIQGHPIPRALNN